MPAFPSPVAKPRRYAVAAALALSAATLIGSAGSASASDVVISPEGYYSANCYGTWTCVWYHADANGAMWGNTYIEFPNLGDYTFSDDSSDGATGAQGAGVVVRNNAHSVQNEDATHYESFFVSPNYTGNENQIVGGGAYGNLSSTLVNNEASLWNTCVPDDDCTGGDY